MERQKYKQKQWQRCWLGRSFKQLIGEYGLAIDITLMRLEQSWQTDKSATKMVQGYETG